MFTAAGERIGRHNSCLNYEFTAIFIHLQWRHQILMMFAKSQFLKAICISTWYSKKTLVILYAIPQKRAFRKMTSLDHKLTFDCSSWLRILLKSSLNGFDFMKSWFHHSPTIAYWLLCGRCRLDLCFVDYFLPNAPEIKADCHRLLARNQGVG